MVKKGKKRCNIRKRILREKAGADSSHCEESKRPLGFACSECLDFQLDLAKSSLEYYRRRKNGCVVFDEVHVLSACFLQSWPRYPSKKYQFTDKCHISFSAKPKSKDFNDVSPIWFFAELMEVEYGDFRPILCETMDPTDQGITYGCGFCPPEMKFPHPHISGVDFDGMHPSKLHDNFKADGFKHHHGLVKVGGARKRRYIKLKKGEKRLSKREAAETALTYDEMYSMYEVQEVAYLEKMPFFWVEIDGINIWYHVGFTAKPSDISSTDASPKRFFAELKFDEGAKQFLPSYCCILETTDSGFRRGCGFCPTDEKYLHPATGYRCGAWDDPPRIDFAVPSRFVFIDDPIPVDSGPDPAISSDREYVEDFCL